MPEFHNASATNSDATNPKDELPKPATGKPTETHPSPGMKEWGAKAVEVSNRMWADEAYRKEIAKRIT